MQKLIEYFTAIDEAKDLANLWPGICSILENDFGWSYLASSTISLLLALLYLAFWPSTIGLIAFIVKAIWNKIKWNQ